MEVDHLCEEIIALKRAFPAAQSHVRDQLTDMLAECAQMQDGLQNKQKNLQALGKTAAEKEVEASELMKGVCLLRSMWRN